MNPQMSEQPMRSILIVEDNESLAFGLKASLQVEGHSVEVIGDGAKALNYIALNEPDLVILDLMLGDVSGFDVLRRMREGGSTAAVLVLSARDQEVDKVVVLRLGADDYVVKPVGVLELIARVEALLRRIGGAPTDVPTLNPEYRFGGIVVDTVRRTIRRGDQLIEVRPMEFDLLLHLLAADGRVVSRRVLMQKVWHYAPDIATRTVDQHINRLRQRLEEDPATPRHIMTVRKAGYRILY